MRLSNAELQEAINSAIDHLKEVKCTDLKVDIAVHVRTLLSEQRRRAHDQVNLELEPMETTVERASFDARVRAQEPFNWEPCNPACDPEFGGYINSGCSCENRRAAQESPWVEWEGGECPVPDNHDVEVKFRDQSVERNKEPQSYRWSHIPYSRDIIAYRDWTAWEAQK